MTEAQAATTRFCARAIGLLMLIIGAIVISRFGDLALIIPALLQDAPLAFVTGVFTLIVGVVLFAAHHHWNSAPAIIITLIALLTIIRGVLLMYSPVLLAGFVFTFVNDPAGMLAAGAMALLIGAWLTFVGWFTKSA